MVSRIVLVLALVLLTCSAQAGQVIVDHVDGLWDGAYLSPDSTVKFYIRLINDNSVNAEGIANGFKVWTLGGTSFTPLHGDTLKITPGWRSMFDLVFSINHLGADGIGVDTVGFGGSRMMSTGLPAGFDKVSYVLTTGNVKAGETLCLDSTYYLPTGTWLWAPGGTPEWSGQLCYESVRYDDDDDEDHDYITYGECPDTLLLEQCGGQVTYTFDLVLSGGITEYSVSSGPGEIDVATGVWTYTPTEDDYGTCPTLVIGADVLWEMEFSCSTRLRFISPVPMDINQNCAANIADLVYLVMYLMGETSDTPIFEVADVDGSGAINIADILYMVDYMFLGGPPPVDPWE